MPPPQQRYQQQVQQQQQQQQQQQLQQQPRALRKRKADAPPENNERLSKRMSLLNLEKGGQKLYVPVEQGNADAIPDSLPPPPPQPHRHHHDHKPRPTSDDDSMQLDDTKYKVYIHNLDDELSSSDGESDDGKLIFLSDIEKHLRSNRIPSAVLNPRPDSDLADKQLVLYRVPTSITVPEEQDSVRKAIIEARARMREKVERESAARPQPVATMPVTDVPMDADVPLTQASGSGGEVAFQQEEGDSDAMELD
ncbi:hypothetical protein QBC42DRAFT_183027 [Cladorrhinum samala]|uniref:Uncharacterized protein n=1 Tax=Cladorrhinum samala TaxID=585594 RepID=A0AAV9HHP8_9PEZI|nr:hypothetical protein QBC42DRAFT_183027 [Cladorrhinum samala]